MKFRPAALRQLEAPEKLDQVVRLASAPAWLMTVTLAVIAALAAAWASVGTVATTVSAQGVLIHAAGTSTLDARDPLEAVVFVPAAATAAIRPGARVALTAAAAPAAVFGTLRGTVALVGKSPETTGSLREILGQDASTGAYLAAGSVIRVVIRLATVPGRPAELAWSKVAPGFTLGAQSGVRASFVIAREHPMEWLVGR